MQHSLSVLLPVHDSQSTLDATVREILDVLPELTPHFELVIVDDGSTDATIEVADDLASCYPQIRAIRHTRPKGFHEAVQTGLAQSRGAIICVRDENRHLVLTEVARQWSIVIRTLSLPTSTAGPTSKISTTIPLQGGVRITTRSMARSIEFLRKEISERTESSEGRPKRPNYLTRIRDFAASE